MTLKELTLKCSEMACRIRNFITQIIFDKPKECGKILVDIAFAVLYISILIYSIKSTYLITAITINQTQEINIPAYRELGGIYKIASYLGFLGFIGLFTAGNVSYLTELKTGLSKIIFFIFLIIGICGITCLILFWLEKGIF